MSEGHYFQAGLQLEQRENGYQGGLDQSSIDLASYLAYIRTIQDELGVSGRRHLFFRNAVEVKKGGDSSNKDFLYFRIADSLVASRKVSKSEPHRFLSHGLVEEVSNKLNATVYDIRGALNGMRADYVSCLLDPKSDSCFQSTVYNFLSKHSVPTGGNKTAPVWKEFWAEWNKSKDVVEFYRFFSEPYEDGGEKSNSLLGSFVPYEALYLRQFYKRKIQKAKRELSPFDMQALGLISIWEEQGVTIETRYRTQIDEEKLKELVLTLPTRADRQDILLHLRALAFGNFEDKLSLA